MGKEITQKEPRIDRIIVRLTVPTVLSNISVPLLGLCDTAVAGHMPEERFLAAIAIGSVMMSTVYWLFGFLRGGTSGITATAYGAKNSEWMGNSLLRSSLLAVGIGVLLIFVHVPVMRLLLDVIGASEGVTELAARYFSICIYGAVPMMVLTALSGWFVGMQATDRAMWVNIGVALLNVVFTLSYVYALNLGFEGIAFGTLTAQWIIVLPAIVLANKLCKKHDIRLRISTQLFSDTQAWKNIFNVNSNLFLRSACLIVATMLLYAFSARLGDIETGANAVINQLFLFFSYFMDGFAFTGEALVGRFNGASDRSNLVKSVRALLKWTLWITVIFVMIYLTALREIVGLLSDSVQVARCVMDCRLWVVLIPVAGAAAFIYDGFYIGLTKTRPMLVSTLFGVGLFVGLLPLIPHTQWMLWMAFTSYLAFRSLILIVLFPYGIKLYSLKATDYKNF